MQVHIPYDVYFKEVQPVATFEFNIACGNVMEALDPLFGKMRPTILYLAKRNSRYATGCKYTEVRQIIKGLSKRLRQPIRRTDVLIYVGDLRILDLVTEKGRDKRKEYLDNGGEADMIIALDTCKEGFDWPKAERSIIIGERHSIPEMIQMIGRLFRRSKGKTHAEVFQIMPAVVENRKSFKDWQNANLTVLFSAMLLEDVFVPVPINGLMARKRNGRRRTRPWRTSCLTPRWPRTSCGISSSPPINAATTKSHGEWHHRSSRGMRFPKAIMEDDLETAVEPHEHRQ